MGAPIILQDTSGLGEGITGAAGALSQALGQRVQEKRQLHQQRQYGSILEDTLGALTEDSSPMQVTQALTQAVDRGVPASMAHDYGTLYATLQKSRPDMPPGPEQVTEMATLFQKFGMSPEISQRNAELWSKLTTGGQTEMAKLLVDQIARNQFLPPEQQVDFEKQITTRSPDTGEVVSQDTLSVSEEVPGFQFPKVNVFEDRTPKERTVLKSQLLKENSSEYKELGENLTSSDREILRYEQLEQLNASGKLPTGFQKYNINWTTGDIRVPALANAETQLYVKTINDFTTAAKDTYGARVTNFELGAFMKRLPTLANSEQGRRLILTQAKAMKAIDRLRNESIQQVYDHYGVQKIDRASAERIAKDLRKDDEKKLIKEVKDSVNAQESYEAKLKAPSGHHPVRKPDGSLGYVPIEKIDIVEKKGWTIL